MTRFSQFKSYSLALIDYYLTMQKYNPFGMRRAQELREDLNVSDLDHTDVNTRAMAQDTFTAKLTLFLHTGKTVSDDSQNLFNSGSLRSMLIRYLVPSLKFQTLALKECKTQIVHQVHTIELPLVDKKLKVTQLLVNYINTNSTLWTTGHGIKRAHELMQTLNDCQTEADFDTEMVNFMQTGKVNSDLSPYCLFKASGVKPTSLRSLIAELYIKDNAEHTSFMSSVISYTSHQIAHAFGFSNFNQRENSINTMSSLFHLAR
jgi:hypothetical protein